MDLTEVLHQVRLEDMEGEVVAPKTTELREEEAVIRGAEVVHKNSKPVGEVARIAAELAAVEQRVETLMITAVFKYHLLILEACRICELIHIV